MKEDFQSIANNIDGIIEFFKIEEIKQNEENLLTDARFLREKGYYIKKEKLNGTSYLIGYLPVRDFYSNIIGYVTIFKPNENISKLLYLQILISLIYTILIIYLVARIKFMKGV